MVITDQRVTAYLDKLYRPLSEFLRRLRAEAEEEGIPIILRDTESFVRSVLEMKRPERILEIGTAVGYSALCFAAAAPEATILTCELRPELAERARKNVERAASESACGSAEETSDSGSGRTQRSYGALKETTVLSERIKVVCGDARETLAALPADTPPFDFVFLDGAHGHYLDMWEVILPRCAPGTVIVSDNVLFKGMTASDDFLDCRRNKTIMTRMREFLAYITSWDGAETAVLPVGDGLALSVIRETGRVKNE